MGLENTIGPGKRGYVGEQDRKKVTGGRPESLASMGSPEPYRFSEGQRNTRGRSK